MKTEILLNRPDEFLLGISAFVAEDNDTGEPFQVLEIGLLIFSIVLAVRLNNYDGTDDYAA